MFNGGSWCHTKGDDNDGARCYMEQTKRRWLDKKLTSTTTNLRGLIGSFDRGKEGKGAWVPVEVEVVGDKPIVLKSKG